MNDRDAAELGRYFMQAKRVWLPALENTLTSTFVDESEKQDVYDFLIHVDKLSDGEISEKRQWGVYENDDAL